jgi:uncharacterized membrane protein HdeD (DUF308 family)
MSKDQVTGILLIIFALAFFLIYLDSHFILSLLIAAFLLGAGMQKVDQ